MSILYTNNIKELKNFTEKKNQLTILNRKAPSNAIYFFDKLIKLNFTIIGEVYKSSALSDVRCILDQQFTKVITNDPFYDFWLEDISLLCKLFCDIEKSNYISLWLGSKRGCQRYHIDDVPQRLLVTYAGQGTEWIPDEAADRNGGGKLSPFTYFIFLLGKYFTLFRYKFEKTFILCSAYQKL